jgi:hypothetical protein
VCLRRTFFDELLRLAVPSAIDGFVELYTPEERVYYPGDHEAALNIS